MGCDLSMNPPPPLCTTAAQHTHLPSTAPLQSHGKATPRPQRQAVGGCDWRADGACRTPSTACEQRQGAHSCAAASLANVGSCTGRRPRATHAHRAHSTHVRQTPCMHGISPTRTHNTMDTARRGERKRVVVRTKFAMAPAACCRTHICGQVRASRSTSSTCPFKYGFWRSEEEEERNKEEEEELVSGDRKQSGRRPAGQPGEKKKKEKDVLRHTHRIRTVH